MNTEGFGMGFFGRKPFGKEARKKFQEEWSKMPDNEKLAFMNKRVENFGSHEEHFSVEAIDDRCEKWMKMTAEEKKTFVDERKKAFENRMNGMGGAFAHMHR